MKQISDKDFSINELKDLCFNQAEKSGWHDKPITFDNMCNLLHSKISEAYEEFRSNHIPDEIYTKPFEPKPEGIPIEFADLLIRLMHYCKYLGIDINEALRIKMEYNATRPYRHGNKQT